MRLVDSQETPGRALMEVRSTRYPKMANLAGVGDTLLEAVKNAMELNTDAK